MADSCRRKDITFVAHDPLDLSLAGGRDAMKVLVVEDDEALCIELVQYLRRRCREVVVCRSVAAARHALREMLAKTEVPARIVCEMGLPDGSGIDLHSEFAGGLVLTRWLLMCDFEDDALRYKPKPAILHPSFVDKPFSLRHLKAFLEDA